VTLPRAQNSTFEEEEEDPRAPDGDRVATVNHVFGLSYLVGWQSTFEEEYFSCLAHCRQPVLDPYDEGPSFEEESGIRALDEPGL
jgi:hypothetical protein